MVSISSAEHSLWYCSLLQQLTSQPTSPGSNCQKPQLNHCTCSMQVVVDACHLMSMHLSQIKGKCMVFVHVIPSHYYSARWCLQFLFLAWRSSHPSFPVGALPNASRMSLPPMQVANSLSVWLQLTTLTQGACIGRMQKLVPWPSIAMVMHNLKIIVRLC